MRAVDLNLQRLLEFDPEGGRLLLGSERMLVFRMDAFARLRRLLFDQLGPTVARSLLLQFGRLCGEGDFHAIGGSLLWDTPEDRAMAGPILHAWEGIVAVVPDTQIVPGMERMTGTWLNSYEAEMHLAEFGPTREPVCYSLQGYAHGHASNAHGVRILCVETACRAMGAPQCRWEMRPDHLWGDEPAAVALREAFAATPESIQRRLERQIEVSRQQHAALVALSAPVLEVWDRVLALPVIGAVDSDRAATMLESLLEAIRRKRADFAVLDLTGAEAPDADTWGHLLRIIAASRLLGSECLISGVSPAAAQAMVELGVGAGIRAFPALKDAVSFAVGARARRGRAAR